MPLQYSDGVTTECAECGRTEWTKPYKPAEKANVLVRCDYCGAHAVYREPTAQQTAAHAARPEAQRPPRGPLSEGRGEYHSPNEACIFTYVAALIPEDGERGRKP